MISASGNSAYNALTGVITSTNTTYSVGHGGLTQRNFTTTLNSKLDAIEASATADQTSTDINNMALTKLGTITTGTWNATAISVAKGGTGATATTGSGSNVLASSSTLSGTTNIGYLWIQGQYPIKGGWHSATKIFVTPADFVVNDDNSYYNLALVDNGGYGKVMSSSLEAYCNIVIPDGYKATYFRVNGTGGVSIAAYYSDTTSTTSTSCQPPQACYTETQYAFYSSAVSASTNGRYIILKWSPSSTSHQLHGAYITIAPI